LFKAAEDFNIDIASSYMVGDSNIDVMAGNSAGCKDSILVSERYSLLDFVKDYILKN
jgi:hypothetical protein